MDPVLNILLSFLGLCGFLKSSVHILKKNTEHMITLNFIINVINCISHFNSRHSDQLVLGFLAIYWKRIFLYPIKGLTFALTQYLMCLSFHEHF